MALTIKAIPDRYQLGFSQVIALPVASVTAIADALGKVEPTRGTRDMVSAVERAANIAPDQAESIITSLRSLYVLKASAEADVSEIVTKLTSAMQRSGKKDLQVPDQEKGILEAKLTELLSLESIGKFSKIEQLKSDHNLAFYDAKIITDLRPVFDDPALPPVGAIISNTLKIVCHEGVEHKELYLSLDSEDIGTLKKLVERAEVKIASLKLFISTSNLADFS